MKSIWTNLNQILDNMGVPVNKRTDLLWLANHLKDENAFHPEYGVAIHFIYSLIAMGELKLDNIYDLCKLYAEKCIECNLLKDEVSKLKIKEAKAMENLGRRAYDAANAN